MAKKSEGGLNPGLFEDGTLSLVEAKKFSGLSRSTLYGLMTAGALRYSKVGTRGLIPRRALVALLAQGVANVADNAS